MAMVWVSEEKNVEYDCNVDVTRNASYTGKYLKLFGSTFALIVASHVTHLSSVRGMG